MPHGRIVIVTSRWWHQHAHSSSTSTAALQAACIPCDAAGITEMIKLIDNDKDGCISWLEFETFMMAELAAGKHLLSGEYVLPSGLALPFGVMINKLKRDRMMGDIMEVGEGRGCAGVPAAVLEC